MSSTAGPDPRRSSSPRARPQFFMTILDVSIVNVALPVDPDVAGRVGGPAVGAHGLHGSAFGTNKTSGGAPRLGQPLRPLELDRLLIGHTAVGLCVSPAHYQSSQRFELPTSGTQWFPGAAASVSPVRRLGMDTCCSDRALADACGLVDLRLHGFDAAGAVTITSGLALLVYTISKAPCAGRPAPIGL